MADQISSAFGSITSAWNQAQAQNAAGATGGSGVSGVIIFVCFLVGFAIISVVGAWLWFHFSEKKKWTILTRCHYENPNINGISFGQGSGIPTKRVRFKDGKVVYIYKTPIQGYTISPELLTWTRPREHDIIVTADKKLFCIEGFTNIDVKRKQLHVDISYPDIEMDRQDLQRFIDAKKYDDPNDRLKMILKAATWVFVMITIIVLAVLGGKYYIDGKNVDNARDQANLQTAKYQAEATKQMNTFILILSKVMPQSFQAIDGQNLLNQTLNS